ncbi:MAG: clostripain-related cysteine peptidase [Candidatus Helarchaeota archaeon]|nr:clostripain-related cysteine peptidase [Candidatus Helarchaeota archaeon]
MRKTFVIISQALLISLLIFSLFGTMVLLPVLKNLSDASVQTTATYDWTYMVYCDGDNNLDSYAVDDINEMEWGYENSASGDVKVIVFLDRLSSGGKTYDIEYDTLSAIDSPILTTGFPSEPNMGSKTTLKNFITYCFNNFPSDHYVLDLWDHGGGIFGICWDDSSSNDKLSFDEVDEAIAESCVAAGERIDILAMDACLMAMIESCYEWHEYVDYIVSSEETIPGDGYPYEDVITDLCDHYSATYNSNPGQFAKDIVTVYHASYYSGDDTTLSSINVQSAPFTNLMTAFTDFTSTLSLQIGSAKSSIAAARASTQEFYYEFFIDLYDFAKEIQSRIPAMSGKCTQLMNNITTVVTSSKQHDNPDAHGMSIYFPSAEGDYDSGYASVIDFGQETQWADFLTSYYSGVVTTYALSLTSYAVDIHGNGIPEQSETLNISVSVKNTGTVTATLVNGTLSCTDGNVTILDGFNLYGTITAGSTITKEFQLSIDALAPNGLVVPLTCIIQATFGAVPYEIGKILNLVINLSAITGGADFASAQTIPQGISNGLLPGPDPTDSSAWFKIAVTEGNYLICSIITAEAGSDFDLYIYSPAGTLLTAAVLGEYPDSCSTYAQTTGEYRIRVTPYTGSGSFTLNVTIASTPGPEDGLSFGTAITIDENSSMPQTGILPTESISGYMFYRVYLTSGQSVSVSLTADSSTDFDVYLVDNAFEVVTQSAGVNYPERFRYGATYDGYYYILVTAYSGSGDYDLTVSFTSAFTLSNWVIILIIVVVIIAVIVGLILFFKMT